MCILHSYYYDATILRLRRYNVTVYSIVVRARQKTRSVARNSCRKAGVVLTTGVHYRQPVVTNFRSRRIELVTTANIELTLYEMSTTVFNLTELSGVHLVSKTDSMVS